MAKLDQVLASLPIFDQEWLKQLSFVPTNTKLELVYHFYQHSKGRLIKLNIASYPDSFEKLASWLEYRKSINKPVKAYLTKIGDLHYLKLRAEDMAEYVYIEIESKRIYVAKNTVIRGQFASFLRYLLYYSGYELKYEKAGRAKSFKPKKTKQISLL